MTLRTNRFIFFSVLILLLAVSFHTIISHDTILSYDDKMLISSLQGIASISDYFHAITNGRILDIQPIRDISYFIDFKLFHLFNGHYSYHLTNVFLLFGICFILEKLFRLLLIKNSYIYLFLILFAFSPVTSSSTGWIAARKHLLATFFIVWANYRYLKKDAKSPTEIIAIIALYSLSILSHPINVLWPFWILIWDCREKIKIKFEHIVLGSLSLLFTGINFWYYKYIYSSQVSSFSKFSVMDQYDLGTPLLAIGRYFFQVIFPFAALPTTHYPGSKESLIGLAMLVVLSFLFLKVHKDRIYALLLMYFFFPLIIVTLNMTNIFCSDTYLLNSSIGIYALLAIYLQKQNHQKLIVSALCIYVGFIFFSNLNYVEIFNNEDELWKYSYEKEATPQNAGVRSSTLVRQGRFQESYNIIETIQNNWPNHPFLSQVIAENIFYNPSINNIKKIEFLNNYSQKGPSTFFYLTILYAREKDTNGIENNLPHIFSNPRQFNTEFRGNEELIGASIKYICNFYKLTSCNSSLKSLKDDIARERWNESLFQELLFKLESSKEFNLIIKI